MIRGFEFEEVVGYHLQQAHRVLNGLLPAEPNAEQNDQALTWLANPNNDHPVIPQNIYRMSGGGSNNDRFEQIGQ